MCGYNIISEFALSKNICVCNIFCSAEAAVWMWTESAMLIYISTPELIENDIEPITSTFNRATYISNEKCVFI